MKEWQHAHSGYTCVKLKVFRKGLEYVLANPGSQNQFNKDSFVKKW